MPQRSYTERLRRVSLIVEFSKVVDLIPYGRTRYEVKICGNATAGALYFLSKIKMKNTSFFVKHTKERYVCVYSYPLYIIGNFYYISVIIEVSTRNPQ